MRRADVGLTGEGLRVSAAIHMGAGCVFGRYIVALLRGTHPAPGEVLSLRGWVLGAWSPEAVALRLAPVDLWQTEWGRWCGGLLRRGVWWWSRCDTPE